MKNFVKLIPVALGLLTLASCSNDDLFGEKAFDATQLQEDEMLVTFEESSDYGDAFTRSYTDRTMKKHRWTEGEDKLRVYGSDFGAYDLYSFTWKTDEGATTGVFKRQHQKSYIGSAKWALFPLEHVKQGTWVLGENNNSITEVTMTLPKFIEYGAAYDGPNYETGADLDPYYLDQLPRFGEVTGVQGGEALQTNMKYMTGVLRLQLAGIPSYATGVKVQLREGGDAAKTLVINGDFTTRIATNNRIEVNGLAADQAYGHAGSAYVEAAKVNEDGAVYVHIPGSTALTARDNRKGVIYVPLPVWDKETAIAISIATDFGGENPASGTKNYKTANWSEYKVLSKRPIQRAKVYGNAKEYNLALDGTDPGAISDALDLVETDDETITIVANEEIEVCEGAAATTIEIPNNTDVAPNVKNIIIDLSKGLKSCGTAPSTLKIIYQSDSNPFTGNVTLIAGKATGTTIPVKLDVNLPKSGFALVAGQKNTGGTFAEVIDETVTPGKPLPIDIDAEEFVVGNDSKYTPTILNPQALKLSTNVKAFTVAKEAKLAGSFVIDQQTQANPEDWTFGAVKTVTVNGCVAGDVDATTSTKSDFKVAIIIDGEQIENSVWGAGVTYDAPTITGGISTRGTVAIKAGKYVSWNAPENMMATVSGDITAEDAITADGYADLSGEITSTKSTVTLKGHVMAAKPVTADLDINVTQSAFVTDDITSNKGNITIDNNITEKDWLLLAVYGGEIKATKGSISLNQAVNKETGKYLVSQFTNAITAGTDFTMTGLTTTTNAILLSGTATINVAPQDGNCVAVAGSLTYQLGSSYKLNLLQGYVKGLDASDDIVELTFATTPAYAALTGVTAFDNVKPTNASVWNGDYELKKYDGDFVSDDWAIDPAGTGTHPRIWTATQLGYMITANQTDVELRSDINLNDEQWPGIPVNAAVTFTGLIDETKADTYYHYKTISNLNLTNPDPTSQIATGFFSVADEAINMTCIKFAGVKTTLDEVTTDVAPQVNKDGQPLPQVDMFGVGTVVGYTESDVELTRVSATLVGGKFGSNGTENVRSAGIGGLVGYAVGTVDLIGCTVDATNAALSGWFSIGGFVGHGTGDIKIKEAGGLGKLKKVTPTVTGFAVNVTHVDKVKTNDLYQGMTGRFIGSSYANVTISNVAAGVVNSDFHKDGDGADETVAFKITNFGPDYNRHFFGRNAQTLVGHDGMYIDNTLDYKINDVIYQIYMEYSPNNYYTPGYKHFYDLTIEPHQN